MKRVKLLFSVIFSGGVILAAACGGAASPPTTAPSDAGAPPPTTGSSATTIPDRGNGGDGPVGQGQQSFAGAGSCIACHTIQGVPAAVGVVGPELTHVGTDAATRKPGTSARDYITESIRDPEAFVAEGVERAVPNIMTQALTAGLSDAEVESLVEFLLAQK